MLTRALSLPRTGASWGPILLAMALGSGVGFAVGAVVTVRTAVAPPPRPDPVLVCARPAEPTWASSVRAVSSQYSATSWSAARVLGPPDVYPRSGDLDGTWASQSPDGQVETIEVGFDAARRLGALDVYETFHPGAITRIEAIGPDGVARTVYQARPAASAGAFRRHLDLGCTAEPVAAVRLTLDSAAVPGWNEIDAIGATPCD